MSTREHARLGSDLPASGLPASREPSGYGDISSENLRRSSFQEYIALLMRGKWLILASVLLLTAGAAVLTYLTKPVFEATSMVLIDMKGTAGAMPFLDITGTAGTNKITNEIETLRSYSMAEDVARTLLENPYLETGRKALTPIVQEVVDGELKGTKDDLGSVTGRLLAAMRFEPVRESDIIRISAHSTDRHEAALLANTYAEVYAQRNLDASRMKSRAIREFLQGQMQAKHQALDTTERAMQAYMRTSGVVSLDAENSKVVQQLSQLEATRDAIDVDVSSRMKTLNSYKEQLQRQEPNIARAISESNDAYIRLLQEQMAKLEVQRDVVIAQNPELSGQKLYSEKVKEIEAQIASLKKNLQDRTRSYLSSLLPGDRQAGGGGEENAGTTAFLSQVKQKIIEQQIELDGLQARRSALDRVITDYERQFNQIPEKSIEFAKLQRARLSSEKLYLLVEEKYNEASISETSEFGYVNFMDRAIVPTVPVSPNPRKNIGFGLGLGIMLGVGLVLLRARLDDRIRTPHDLKKYGIVPLSTISRMEWERSNGNGHNGTLPSGAAVDRHLVAFLNPFSALAEAYRHLRTNVLYAQPDRPLKSIIVTSAAPQEGKSTTAANLSITFAQTESQVLLIDADMRRPSINKLFSLEQTPGLTDVLFGRAPLETAVHHRVIANLDILCCGTIPPNPAEILSSRRMAELMGQLLGMYDVLIFDSPPLLAVTDSAILSRITDGIVLVAAAGTSTLGSLERTSEILAGVNKRAIGIVLNNFDLRKAYAGYNPKHGYGQYVYGYGYTDTNGGGKKKEKVRRENAPRKLKEGS